MFSSNQQDPKGHNSLKEFGVLGCSSVLMSLKRLSAHKEWPRDLLPRLNYFLQFLKHNNRVRLLLQQHNLTRQLRKFLVQ